VIIQPIMIDDLSLAVHGFNRHLSTITVGLSHEPAVIGLPGRGLNRQ
jgi:hypothetical protein